jgi:hypothetical protein
MKRDGGSEWVLDKRMHLEKEEKEEKEEKK